MNSSKTSLIINQNASILEAIQRLEECKGILTLVVTEDGSKDSRVIGTLSDGDIRRWFINHSKKGRASNPNVRKSNVMEAMQKDPIKISNVSDSWFEKIQRARELGRKNNRNIRIIPIVNTDDHLLDILDLVATKQRHHLEVILMATAHIDGEYLPCLTYEDIIRRRDNYDTNRTQYQISKYEALAELTSIEISTILNQSRIDELYMALKRGSDWARRLQTPEVEVQRRLQQLASNLTQAKNNLIISYLGAMALVPKSYIGSPKAAERPNFLFVLGCARNDEQQERVLEAIRILSRLFSTKGSLPRAIILSGGGKGPSTTEAAMMKEILTKNFDKSFSLEKPDGPILLLEEDSLDTVGNAVFGNLLLLKEGLLSEAPKSICIVTSDYHAQRTLNIFKRIFESPEKPTEIAVCMAKTDGDIEKKAQLAIKQLDSEFRANRETFGLENVVTGLPDSLAQARVRSVFFQLLQYHDLYRHREDLIRKYKEVLGPYNVPGLPR